MNFAIYLLLYSLGTLIFAIYSKFQFEDDRGESQGKWHTPGFYMRLLACVTPFIASLWPIDWRNWLLISVIQMPWWDVSINIIALKMKAWYLGTTAQTDQLKAKKWLLYGIALILAIVIKIFVKFTNQDIITWISQL